MYGVVSEFACLQELDRLIDWLSMVLRLHQHNIGYTADGKNLIDKQIQYQYWRCCYTVRSL